MCAQEVEFPTASLDAVPGDAEGGIEMTLSMEMLHEFARMFTASGETKSNARVVPPPPLLALWYPLCLC